MATTTPLLADDAPVLPRDAVVASSPRVRNPDGYGVTKAVVLSFETVAGIGVLSMPVAFSQAGWASIALFLGCAAICGFTAVIEAWIQDLLRDKEANADLIYEVYGRHAYGRKGELAVIYAKHFTLFGVAIAFLILAGENIAILIPGITPLGGLLVCFAVVLPGSWFPTLTATAKVAPFAAASFIGALLAIAVAMLLDTAPAPAPAPVTFSSFALAFGQFAFAFSGHAGYPAVQREMKTPSDFSKVILPLTLCLIAIKLPIAIIGFVRYGGATSDNILSNISSHPTLFTRIITAMITIHVLFSFVLAQYPVSRTLHRLSGIPDDVLSAPLVLLRSAQTAAALLVAWLVPYFGTVLALLGGSSVSLVAFILPCLFYLKLQPRIHPAMRAALYACVVFGVVAGVASTASATIDLVHKLSAAGSGHGSHHVDPKPV